MSLADAQTYSSAMVVVRPGGDHTCFVFFQNGNEYRQSSEFQI
jgi:hypothetical protein